MSSKGRQTSGTQGSLLSLAHLRATVMRWLVHMVVICNSSGGAASEGLRRRGNDLQGRWPALCSRGVGGRRSKTSCLAALVMAVTAVVLDGGLRGSGLCRHKVSGEGGGERILDRLGD